MDDNEQEADQDLSGGVREGKRSEPSAPAHLTDTEFAVAVDARLWVSPSGEMRNNTENYRAVDDALEDRDDALKLLQHLLERLIRLQSWRTFPQLAAPVLEALLFVQDIVGQIAVLGPDDVKPSR